MNLIDICKELFFLLVVRVAMKVIAVYFDNFLIYFYKFLFFAEFL